MSDIARDPACRNDPPTGWGIQRIWIAGALGAMLAGSQQILDFWPLGAGGSLGHDVRALFDLSRVLFVLLLVCFVVGLLIAAGIALWRGHLQGMASSIFAVAAIPVCIVVVAKVPLFDPWLWYAMANSSRFEAVAASSPPLRGPKYAVVEGRDVSTGIAGLNPNHSVLLIYDESDAIGLEPSERPAIWLTRNINLEGATCPKGGGCMVIFSGSIILNSSEASCLAWLVRNY